MKHWIVTIRTSYSIEEYLIPAQENEDIETATDNALSSIAFCDDYDVLAAVEANCEYMNALNHAKKEFETLTGETVKDSFTCGDFATLADVLFEMKYRRSL